MTENCCKSLESFNVKIHSSLSFQAVSYWFYFTFNYHRLRMYRSTSNLYILIPFLTLWTPLPTQSSLEKLCNVSQYPHITWVTSALPLHMVMKQYSNIFRHYSTRGPHSPIITHDVSGMFQQAPFFHPSAFCSSASHSIWGKHFLEEENILQEQKIHAIWIFLFRQTHFPGKGALLQKPKVWFGSTVLLLL